jgi:hypothetical protein
MVAEFVMVPVGCTLTLKVSLAPLAIAPIVQKRVSSFVLMLMSFWHDTPVGAVKLVMVNAPFCMKALMVTPVAAKGPLFVATIVYVAVPPAEIVAGPVMVTERSAPPEAGWPNTAMPPTPSVPKIEFKPTPVVNPDPFATAPLAILIR